MNRREMFQRIAGAVAASGVPTATLVKADAVHTGAKPALMVFSIDSLISHETSARIIAHLQEALKGTPVEGVKAVVLSEGAQLTFLDADGHVLNERLTDA